jgi:hypothetical protein
MIKTETKRMTLDKAISKVNQINRTLLGFGYGFSIKHKPIFKQIVFTSVSDCDGVKATIREFEIRFDERAKRYAELVINYE